MATTTVTPGVVRTASCAGVPLSHPTPDLQSLQGAYVQNVERLEERAERMSLGSNIGEEIRKICEEQKRSDSIASRASRGSRRSSLEQHSASQQRQRPRDSSLSSYTNSIVEVNGAARYGGYSPSGYIGSPLGSQRSLRSGSWSQVSHPTSMPATVPRSTSKASRSTSKASRLGNMSSPETDTAEMHEELQTTPNARHSRVPANESTSRYRSRRSSAAHSRYRLSTGRLPSDASYTGLYDQSESQTETRDSAVFGDLYESAAKEVKYDPPPEQTTRVSIYSPTSPNASRRQTLEANNHPLSPQRSHQSFLPPVQQGEASDFSVGFDFTGHGQHTLDVQNILEGQNMEGGQILPGGQHRLGIPDGPIRPSSAGSMDTLQQAQALFKDFDGTHYRVPSLRIPSGETDDGRGDVLRDLPHFEDGVPPPDEDMVFYPAPVPRTLNLPQRLSQGPSAAVHARRRTQIINTLSADVRKSAAWLKHDSSSDPDLRKSKHMSALPPQLRASVFFEHQSRSQEVEVRESAVATLDDLLNASAHAPVSAFTDHPFAGRAGAKGIYEKEHAPRNSTHVERPAEEKKKRRSSFLGLRRASAASEDLLADGRKTPNRLQKRDSRPPSLGNGLDDSALARGPNGEIGGVEAPSQPRIEIDGPDDEAVESDEEAEPEPEEEEEEPMGRPTTLLAELQIRKAQLRQRNRTAVTAFPNGMHSTLLELDAVAQVEKKKRQKARVALAWEDEPEEDPHGDDEDVPLGMLFPAKNGLVKEKLAQLGLADWDRPLGLLEKRDIEENEPLARRAARLRGGIPVRASQYMIPSIVADEPSEDEEEEGETLGQRLRRLKAEKEKEAGSAKSADARSADPEARPLSSTFATELLGDLGAAAPASANGATSEAANDKDKPEEGTTEHPTLDPGRLDLPKSPDLTSRASSPAATPLDPPDRSTALTPGDDETLGQRRARLQREREAAAAAGRPGPPKRKGSRMTLLGTEVWLDRAPEPVQQAPTGPYENTGPDVSMHDLLQNMPAGKHVARKVSNDMLTAALPRGSLLRQNEEARLSRVLGAPPLGQRTSQAQQAHMRAEYARHSTFSGWGGQGQLGLVVVDVSLRHMFRTMNDWRRLLLYSSGEAVYLRHSLVSRGWGADSLVDCASGRMGLRCLPLWYYAA
ncbi:hypothetical protein EJ06DRAFT_548818 [Trichodelitschia bisporula]|uniref:Uncharacterized protein n=1 Tax=Trichodelitschia bisporula TaxID=703511 RepID=A0A6G1HY23_9PEZI|nr:hypothetical protein EJ06DRAFT_548818 [Trichodelitschia bisporula]